MKFLTKICKVAPLHEVELGWMVSRPDFPWTFGAWIYNGTGRFSGREFLFETLGM